MTVFTHRSEYNRLRNLELVSSALNRRWDTELRVNKRNDIICRDRWKVGDMYKVPRKAHISSYSGKSNNPLLFNSGTSDKGPSEIGTTSLQRTLVSTPC